MPDQTELHAFVTSVARRWQRQRALRVAGAAAAVAGLPLFGTWLVDAVAAPAGAWLIALVASALLAAAATGAWVAWRARRRPGLRQVARFIEERAAALPGGHAADDGLVSAVEIGAVNAVNAVNAANAANAANDESGTAAFRPLILAAARTRVSDLSEADIVTSGEMRSGLVRAVSGAAVLGVALVLATPAVQRAADTLRIRYFPASIRITVMPGDVRVPAGSALRIRAALDGAGGRVKTVPPVLVVSAGGEQRSVPMAPAGEAFEYAFESVDRSFAYRIAAGRAQSADYRVTALYPPKVTAIDLRYEFPSFAGLPPREERGGGDIYGPAGTRVRVRVHTDKAVSAGALALSGAPVVALRDAGERLLEADLVLRADGAYRVSLGDADGLRSLGATEYFIRLMDDRPPDVRILRPSSDSEITPLEEVTIEARADDDYGIASFDLVYAVSGGPERTVRFDRVTGTDVQRVGSRLLPVEDLNVKPGDVVTYYARARDVGRGKRPTETRSDIYFLEVKPFVEEYVAAQSQAGGAAAAQIESLIEAQKEIISATWNIERRSQAGRSTEDVRAVARAQADLKARAEQMSGRTVRGRRGIVPQQRVEPRPDAQTRPPARQAPAADPIGAAVEAMARAATELQDQKTKTAIPHEMTALNGLLQAQAEVRRRQVSQGTGGGNAWGNRQGQDLSALFDKELQRQQRTNYESQTRVETRPEQPEPPDRAADRVRDLARRQEDLNRRQRELADAGVSPAERRRLLEKLTRDQAELRQQAEQLARDLSGTNGGQSKGGQEGGQANGVRGASNDMRSASGELGRDDPRAAASSGERALEQLRRVEQGLREGASRGASPSSGDLQLEAQQIAQEQRRITGEAERLRQQKGGATDGARRLADEKDRLAGRVNRLRQSAEQQSAGPGAANLAEAVRAIDRERIGQRMRESASRLRGHEPGAVSANPSAEKDLAEAVERVADTLGGTASAETRRLSDDLRETRALRDRLDSLEQRMREAAEPPARGARTGGTGQPSKGGADLQSLQQEYQRELDRARQMLGTTQTGQPGVTGGAPEQHEFSRSAPGTERFKQDTSGWESLRRQVDSALETREASVSDRLARVRAAERFAAGGSEHVPERYRRQIAKYYEALAKPR